MNAISTTAKPNAEAMRQHLEHLFGGYLDGCHEGLIELAWTNTTPDAEGKYKLSNARLFGTDKIEELIEETVRLNSQPMCNVYIGAALRKPETPPFGRTSDDDAYALTCGYIDLDDAGAAAAAKGRYGQVKPTLVVVTGREPHVRTQMWWRLTEPCTDPALWPGLLRGMCAALDGDSTVCNPARVMRLAGTIAWPVKQGRTVELTYIHALTEPGAPAYVYEHLAAVFPPIASGSPDGVKLPDNVQYSTNSLGLPDRLKDGRETYMVKTISACLLEYIGETGGAPSAQELFEIAWPQYERNVDLTRPGRGIHEFALKCRYTVARFERGKIRGIENVDKAIEVYQGKQRAQSAAPAGAPATKVTQRFVFEKIGDLRKLPPLQFLVKSWIPANSIGIFYGKWAAGKSFVGFDLVLHLAYGMTDWHGADLPGHSIDVLVISREGHQGFVSRVDAFKKHHGLPDDDDHLTFMRGSVSFMRDEEFAALCEAIKATKIQFGLVLVDTVARVLPGVDMNEQQTITLFMERIAVLGAITGASVIGVHHQNKSGGMMGSAFFEANSDFVFEITRHGEDGSLSSGEIFCTKMKDAEDGWRRSVSYTKVPLSVIPDGPSSLVVESIGEHKPEAKTNTKWPDTETCRRVLSAMGEAWFAGRPWSNSPNTQNDGRYAPRLISLKFDIPAGLAKSMVERWLVEGVLAVEVVSTKSKLRGLKVIGSIA